MKYISQINKQIYIHRIWNIQYLTLYPLQSKQMYSTSPSWSIRGKNKSQKIQQSPSPCGYFVDKFNTMDSPSWKIGTSKRNKQNNNCVPGPGQYENSFSHVIKKHGKFNKENYHKFQCNQNPSPQSYSPNFSFTRPSSPASRMSHKHQDVKSTNTPGPGDYQFSFYLKSNKANIKIGGEKRFVFKKAQGPDPLTYNPVKQNFKNISVSFTKEQKKINNSIDKCSEVPGRNSQFISAGQYESLDFFQSTLHQKRGFKFSSKQKAIPLNQNPGPCQYSPIFVSQPQSSKVSMKGKRQNMAISNTPGPGQYSITSLNQDKNKSFGYSIGKSQRGYKNLDKDNPGPGAYNPQVNLHQTPKYSIYGSRIQQNKSISPGPGSYNPNKNAVKRRPQSAKIGNSKRCEYYQNSSPGPGEYHPKQRPKTPSNRFSKQVRIKHSAQVTPGPGDYHINSIIGQKNSYFRRK